MNYLSYLSDPTKKYNSCRKYSLNLILPVPKNNNFIKETAIQSLTYCLSRSIDIYTAFKQIDEMCANITRNLH